MVKKYILTYLENNEFIENNKNEINLLFKNNYIRNLL
jgi:hypothetical protein